MTIESLTAEQDARLPAIADEWTKIGLCTDPADRSAAEMAIRDMYRLANLADPKIFWCGSPLSLALTGASVRDSVGASVGASVRASVEDSVRDSVWDSVGASVRASVRASVGDSVRASVWASVRASVWASVRASVEDSVRESFRASVGDSVWASVWASVGDSVRASVRDSVRASVGDSVRASVWASVGDSVRDSVRDSVWASVGDSVRASVWASVGDSVRDSVGASVRASVGDSVRDSVGASVEDSVRESFRASVGDSVWDSVWNSVGGSVGGSVWASVAASVVYGSHEAGWLSFYRAMHEFGLVKETAPLSGLWALARSAGWAMPYEGMCFVSERHNILSLDNAGRLHSLSGPAVGYPDGWLIYAVHGVVVPERVIMLPETITAAEITAEPNVEIRRVMIERLGYEKYATDTNLKLIDSCPANHPLKGLRTARLLRDSSDLYLLDMLNSTPEPDGTTKRYLLAIDPTCYNGRAGRECLAAMASTWRRESDMSLIFDRPEDYSPMAES
jgi:hypothetical protein